MAESDARSFAHAPGDPATPGNLAVAQLMAGQLSDAKDSSSRALTVDPGDKINRLVRGVMDEVEAGTRAQPKTLGGT